MTSCRDHDRADNIDVDVDLDGELGLRSDSAQDIAAAQAIENSADWASWVSYKILRFLVWDHSWTSLFKTPEVVVQSQLCVSQLPGVMVYQIAPRGEHSSWRPNFSISCICKKFQYQKQLKNQCQCVMLKIRNKSILTYLVSSALCEESCSVKSPRFDLHLSFNFNICDEDVAEIYPQICCYISRSLVIRVMCIILSGEKKTWMARSTGFRDSLYVQAF